MVVVDQRQLPDLLPDLRLQLPDLHLQLRLLERSLSETAAGTVGELAGKVAIAVGVGKAMHAVAEAGEETLQNADVRSGSPDMVVIIVSRLVVAEGLRHPHPQPQDHLLSLPVVVAINKWQTTGFRQAVRLISTVVHHNMASGGQTQDKALLVSARPVRT